MTDVPQTPLADDPDEFWRALVAHRNDLPALLRVIAERVVDQLGGGCVLTTADAPRQVLVPRVVLHVDPVVSDAMVAVLAGQEIAIGEAIAGNVAADRRAVLLNDLPPATIAGTTPARFLPFVRDHPVRALMIVPMIASGELVGTLGSLRTSSAERYTPDDLRLLEGLADQAALAIAEAIAGPRAIGSADYEAIYRNNLDGVLFSTPDGHMLAANPAARTILGRTEQEILHGGRDAIVVADDPNLASALAERAELGHTRAQLLLRRGDGTTFPADVSSTIYTTPDGKVRTVIIFRDITAELADRDAAIERLTELEEAADRDPLTSLWNRRGFSVAAGHALADADRRNVVSQLVFVDVDGLKAINDTYGHSTGDAAIVAAASAIDRSLRDADVACRLGGDEFVFLAIDTPAAAVVALVERIEEELARDTTLPAPLSISVGLAERAPHAPATLGELIDTADRDMYQQKVLRRLGAPD